LFYHQADCFSPCHEQKYYPKYSQNYTQNTKHHTSASYSPSYYPCLPRGLAAKHSCGSWTCHPSASPSPTYTHVSPPSPYLNGQTAKTSTQTNTPSHPRSEEHTSELQSRFDLVCRPLLEKQNTQQQHRHL